MKQKRNIIISVIAVIMIVAIALVCMKCNSGKQSKEPETSTQKDVEDETTTPENAEAQTPAPEVTETETTTQKPTEPETTTQQLVETETSTQQPTEPETKQEVTETQPIDTSLYSIYYNNHYEGLFQSIAFETNATGFDFSDNTENEEELKEKITAVKEQTIDYTKDSNNDGISDYYTKLICSGKLRNESGNVIPELIGKYDEFQKNSDYDHDGIPNDKEIIITSQRGMTIYEIASNPADYDTDDDGISDGVEKEQGTNPNKYNVPAYNVDFLMDNEMYMSSVFSEDFLDNWGLQVQIYGGNIVGNFKFSVVNDYKKALLNFIQIYCESTYEEKAIKYMKEFMEEKLDDVESDYAELLSSTLIRASSVRLF